MGGIKDILNVVFLTAREHFICHLLATKMFNGKYHTKMLFAFNGMRAINKGQEERYINSRFYERVKPAKRNFIRLYKGDYVKYFYEEDVNKVEKYIKKGWSKEMTAEYKVGRVGCNEGKKCQKKLS